MPSRKDALTKLAIAAAIGSSALITLAQASAPAAGTASSPATAPAASAPATVAAPTLTISPAPTSEVAVPATAPAPIVPLTPAPAAAAPAPATAPASGGEVAAVTQPFIGAVSSDKVYIRSGPGTAYYELGQLTKGDLVYVVGASRGWYQILPPNGTFCMIAKELVDADGTVNKDYVNLRAGTAVSKNRDPSAVLNVVRKGTKLHILGQTDKYYEVAPTEQSYVYISPQFVQPSQAAEYKVPELKLPAGATGPGNTVEAPSAPPTLAGGGAPANPTANSIQPIPTPSATDTSAPAPAPAPAPGPIAAPEPLPALHPAVTYSASATDKFRESQSRYQEEAKKPLSDQNVEPLQKDFQDILAMDNIAPSVKAGAQANLDAISRTLTLQKLMKEQAAAQDSTQKQSAALQEQYESAQRALEAARQAGPYVAEGVLQTSSIVQGKYALVNPQTGRVVAYVDPADASVDIGSLVGKYIGVRGISKKAQNSDITVIQVSNATLEPAPATMPK